MCFLTFLTSEGVGGAEKVESRGDGMLEEGWMEAGEQPGVGALLLVW